MTKNALLIFTRNPELGKVKSRLAKTIGKQAALDVYNFLLAHTVKITEPLTCSKFVYYSEDIPASDIWNTTHYTKKLQKGKDLGERMENAISEALQTHDNAIVIGSDMFDLATTDIENAFQKLTSNDVVIGPAEDGGYYLIGMTKPYPVLFKNKIWGTNTVLKDTLTDLKREKNVLLEERNDVDYYEDIKDIPAFYPFLKHIEKT